MLNDLFSTVDFTWLQFLGPELRRLHPALPDPSNIAPAELIETDESRIGATG